MKSETRSYSLQRRLLSMMAFGFAVLLLIISFLLWNYARGAANRTYDLLLAGAALSVLERVSPGANGPSVDLPSSAMEILALAPDDRVVYRVFSPDTGVITGTSDLPFPADIPLQATPVFFDAAYGDPFRFVVQGRQMNSPQGRLWVVVQIGQTLDARRAQQMSFFLNGMTGLAGISLIGLGFVWLAIRRALSPLRRIEADLRARAPGDLTPFEGAPPREISGLLEAINSFIARLDRNLRLTEGFIADVAHQTRTSLSALQGHLSLAADSSDLAKMQGRLTRAERQAERTVRLTNQLLANAMVIHRSDRATLKPVALKPVVRDTLAEMLRDSRMRKIVVTFDADHVADGEDMLIADALSVREALRNLIDNAVRHGPPDNKIDIALDVEDDALVLKVEDAGPGIAEADRARATERFSSIKQDTAGSGLGLAIVQAVADGHGAKMRLATSRNGGLAVTIAFPRLVRRTVAPLVWVAALLLGLSGTGTADAQTITVFSATDTPAMAPVIAEFEALNPSIKIVYEEYQTVSLHEAMLAGATPDVVISSAMDLQVDLVNRGIARRLDIAESADLPDWATWRSELFGFTFEPAVIVYNRAAFDTGRLPKEHRELANFIRDNETVLSQRIGIYDLRGSGIGYLFATQDAVQGLQAQRTTEVLGRTGVRTFCCTSEMIAATAAGEISIAINVIGSYAMSLAAQDPRLGVHFLSDYNLVMARSAFVPKAAEHAAAAERFVRFLLSEEGQRAIATRSQLIPIRSVDDVDTWTLSQLRAQAGSFLPIRFGPGLLTYLDALKKENFLEGWEASVRPPR
ncbi:MAG: extracellular solute-binding protein [Yoonia sp.]|uniref:sensor histidine kinase n=1 Tax=Yoonia sp. TaxID=2212373 RepID=UPI00273F2ACA|nr:extracellular solute-binding protein [Yoonia sp.]MDP5085512.1 extracellular solute-binding protein [Yoonia sp.]